MIRDVGDILSTSRSVCLPLDKQRTCILHKSDRKSTMGLSAPKKRAKLSHDPNNTAWARNTESFGHKILSSHGWAPGQTLGAEGAAHADHYTAASNSHIRVLLKDDQLGLGASRAGNNADTFGLSLFSGILGRLNGKSDVQLEKEQATQRDVQLALYQSRKAGFVNFVSAGFLVGDRIDKAELMKKKDLPPSISLSLSGEKSGNVLPSETEGTEQDTDKKEDPLAKSKGTKRKRAAQVDVPTDTDSSSDAQEDEDKAKTTSKKSRKPKTNDSSDEERAAKKAVKSERRAEKDRRRADKEQRRAEKEDRRKIKEDRRKKKEAKRAARSATNTPTESVSGTSTPQTMPFIGRHAVRQRYIAAKGRAHLDPQALKEIFMVKAA